MFLVVVSNKHFPFHNSIATFENKLYNMTYLLEIKETPESKHLLEHLRTLKYVKVKNENGKAKKQYHFTDEEMAMPGVNPTQQEFEEWLTQTDKDKGSKGETVRKRLVEKLHKEFSKKK